MRGTMKFGLAVALLAGLTQTASLLAQTTYYVNADCGDDAWSGLSQDCVPEDGPKRTIGNAIQAAVSGDTILVAPGTYRENLDYRGKNLVITSTDGPEVTVIDGGGRNASVVLLVRGRAATR